MTFCKSVAVFGGTGLLGSKICEIGCEFGYNVTSFSRSIDKINIRENTWMEKVKWKSANIFKPESYSKELKQFDIVIHSIGILFENLNYKEFINDEINLMNIKKSIEFVQNLNKNHNNIISYKTYNRDSALILANEFLNQKKHLTKKPTFVYISAEKAPPFVPSNYIISKRDAEFQLQNIEGLRTLIFRPGFMFDSKKNICTNKRYLIASFMNLIFNINISLFKKITILSDIITPPVDIEKVSRLIYKKIRDSDSKGITTSNQMIQKL